MAKYESKPRTNSIAGRIHRSYLYRILAFFLLFDVLVMLLVIGLFLGNLEWTYLGSAWRLDLDRSFSYELPEQFRDEHWSRSLFEGVYYQFGPRKEFLLENPELISDGDVIEETVGTPETNGSVGANEDHDEDTSGNTDGDASGNTGGDTDGDTEGTRNLGNTSEADDSIGIEGSWDSDPSQEIGETSVATLRTRSERDANPMPSPPLETGYKVYLKEPLRLASLGFLILLTFQIIALISLALKGRKRVLRSLRPLQMLAEKAEELSEVSLQEVALDSERYHELEHAIAEFMPSSPDDRLTTGDKELMGLETAINNLLGKMHDSYQQQNRFVSDASHELKTPIAVIQGYADLLARWGSQDEAVLQESIQAIQDEARQMQLLVEQLLFLARGDTGRQALNFETLDLSELVRDVGDEFAMIDEAHEWVVDADEIVELHGDRNMLKQVMRILCDNAKKYSAPDTRIQLSTSIEDDYAIFTIQDAGEGIPHEALPMIFERFYRADPARAKHTGGTGLGLSIADWIVTQHGGYFRVLSREGLGTRFRIFLPLNAQIPARSLSAL